MEVLVLKLESSDMLRDSKPQLFMKGSWLVGKNIASPTWLYHPWNKFKPHRESKDEGKVFSDVVNLDFSDVLLFKERGFSRFSPELDSTHQGSGIEDKKFNNTVPLNMCRMPCLLRNLSLTV